MTAHSETVRAAAEADYLLPVQVVSAGPYNDPTNGDYFKGRIEHSPAAGMGLSISYSQVVTPTALLAAERARIDRILWDLAADAPSVLAASLLMAARRRIAETATAAPEEPS